MSEAIARAIDNRALTKASQVLTGIVTGIVADGHLHDMEIQMLHAWLSANKAVTVSWPGNAIATLIQHVLADGHVSEPERLHLLGNLQALVGSDFSETSSVSAGPCALPFDTGTLSFTPGQRLCFTGEFLYGTRNACMHLATKAGLETVASVSKKLHALIVGSHISPDWVNTSYGLKIARAMELRDEGCRILIIHERDWIAALACSQHSDS